MRCRFHHLVPWLPFRILRWLLHTFALRTVLSPKLNGPSRRIGYRKSLKWSLPHLAELISQLNFLACHSLRTVSPHISSQYFPGAQNVPQTKVASDTTSLVPNTIRKITGLYFPPRQRAAGRTATSSLA